MVAMVVAAAVATRISCYLVLKLSIGQHEICTNCCSSQAAYDQCAAAPINESKLIGPNECIRPGWCTGIGLPHCGCL